MALVMLLDGITKARMPRFQRVGTGWVSPHRLSSGFRHRALRASRSPRGSARRRFQTTLPTPPIA